MQAVKQVRGRRSPQYNEHRARVPASWCSRADASASSRPPGWGGVAKSVAAGCRPTKREGGRKGERILRSRVLPLPLGMQHGRGRLSFDTQSHTLESPGSNLQLKSVSRVPCCLPLLKANAEPLLSEESSGNVGYARKARSLGSVGARLARTKNPDAGTRKSMETEVGYAGSTRRRGSSVQPPVNR